MKRDVLFHNKWLQVRSVTLNNGFEYIYSHSPWCNSQGVAVLGFRDVDGERQYLGRYEVCPAHGIELELTSLTGGMDDSMEFPINTAVRELEEEGGYKVESTVMIPLGKVKSNKSSDYQTHMFAVDLTGVEKGEAIGDGTLGEEGAYTDWVSERDAILCTDPVVGTMIARLKLIGAGV